jgi:OOP family OmpA-OmpF porin
LTERGSIIIDGHTIVVSGKVDGNRAKATVLRDIALLTQTGLELEDRIQAGPSPKVPSPKVHSPKALPPTTRSMAASTPKAPSLHVAPSLAVPSLVEIPSSSLQTKLNEILSHTSIEFGSNTTTMTPRSAATLDQLIDQLRHAPRTAIEIGGHTDKYGEPDYNVRLSRRRAEAVRRYFVSHGLTNQFTTVGYGASRPLSVAENRAGLQRNRRIELRVKGQADL